MNPTIKALRFLTVPLVVTAFGLANVVLRDPSDTTPATAGQKRAALGKIRCRDDLCFATLSPPVSQCAAVAGCDGCDPDFADGCPGDVGYVAPTGPKRLRRLLFCSYRFGALTAWHSDPVLPGDPCGVSLLFSRAQARAWVERLDAASSTALVDVHIASAPDHLKRGAGRSHTWGGVDPADDMDELADGGVLDAESLPDGGP